MNLNDTFIHHLKSHEAAGLDLRVEQIKNYGFCCKNVALVIMLNTCGRKLNVTESMEQDQNNHVTS